jgi:hypothetical protein
MIGFVALLPTYQLVPACAHAVAGDCRGGDCPCAAHRLPEGLRGQGVPQDEINIFWERLAATCPPAGPLFPQAWA